MVGQAGVPPTVLAFLHSCGSTMAEIAQRCAYTWASPTSPPAASSSEGGVKGQSSSGSSGGSQGGAGLEVG